MLHDPFSLCTALCISFLSFLMLSIMCKNFSRWHFKTDMLSLPKIAGGSRKNNFSHASRNFKKISRKKTKVPILGRKVLKSYACKLEKNSGLIRSSPNIDQKRTNAWTEWETHIKYENQSILMPLLHCGKCCPKWQKDRHLWGFAPRKKVLQ